MLEVFLFILLYPFPLSGRVAVAMAEKGVEARSMRPTAKWQKWNAFSSVREEIHTLSFNRLLKMYLESCQ